MQKDIKPGRMCDGLKYLMALLTYLAHKLILIHLKSHDILGLVDQRTSTPKQITLTSKRGKLSLKPVLYNGRPPLAKTFGGKAGH